MIETVAPLAVVAIGVGLIVGAGILSRGDDPGDTYSVDDYRPPREPSRLMDGYQRRLVVPTEILPPVTERCPVYAEALLHHWHPELRHGPDVVAAAWLREANAHLIRSAAVLADEVVYAHAEQAHTDGQGEPRG